MSVPVPGLALAALLGGLILLAALQVAYGALCGVIRGLWGGLRYHMRRRVLED